MTFESKGERRKAPRVATNLQGILGDGEQATCRVTNLSKAGALAVSSQPLDEMSTVRIQVTVKNDNGVVEDFACEAAVVRCDRRPDGDYDLGLYFTAIEEDARTVLQNALQSSRHAPIS